ncbi:oxidoreductase [Exophiala aquamarina CBS 119918]|uniref:Oxidoreductase n=1 Tax=Exophiala aquamarina CBS 119918 TaxID=1182545 RepID=A0A072NVJ9_9EURO|nr:oxidoreductase [Exophiala aquamarina CBS 119918]KEF51889.1 oxidoreductase [Exophiala aquamarina CBS 119918]
MSQAPAWHEAYPSPRNVSLLTIEREELLTQLQMGKQLGIDFLLVDLRRADHEGGTIKGSINLPAQSLYPSLPTLLNLCQAAGVKQVIWYCGSSKGRGSRAAGWFNDLIKDRNVEGISSIILKDGVAGWANAGEDYTVLMEEYNASTWASQK